MTENTLSIGDRVAGIYGTIHGTVLDYSGTVEDISRPASAGHHALLRIRYANGFEHTTIGHPDFVFSMASVLELAGRYAEEGGARDIDAASVAAFLAARNLPLDAATVGRVLWALKYDRKLAIHAISAQKQAS
jgi:hypothetical protein